MKKKKPKKTFLIKSLAGGGAENVCVNIANSFAKKGYDVDLVILNLNNEAYLTNVSKKIKIVNLKVNHARNSPLPLLKYIFKNKLKKILVFNYELSSILVILRILFRLKFKIISRNINTLSFKIKLLEQQNFWKKYIVKSCFKFFYCKVDHVVNQCYGMQDDLISIFPQLDANSSVIYNPISEKIMNEAALYDLNRIKKKDYLLCVGRLEKQKAFHVAINVFAEIAHKFPKLRLKILGQGSLEQKLRQQTIDCNIKDRVDFEGFQKNISSYYLYAKATVLTSEYEGFPNTLIESIAFGTPVIAFNCKSGPSEIIKHGVNGYLVDYKNTLDLRNKLVDVIRNKFSINEMINSIEKFKLNNISKRYEKLLIK